jgi:hypothetical protein
MTNNSNHPLTQAYQLQAQSTIPDKMYIVVCTLSFAIGQTILGDNAFVSIESAKNAAQSYIDGDEQIRWQANKGYYGSLMFSIVELDVVKGE